MTLYRDSALVLRTWKLGESDRIVSMLGQESGKIRAVVKGVRKTKSRFGSRLEPLSLVSILCWKGRELDVVSQAETIELFRAIREDLDRLYKANIILEATEQIAQERFSEPELFKLVVRVLRILDTDNPQMLLGSFIWKLLALQGYRPQMTTCVICGSSNSKVGFDAAMGGVLCGEHANGRRVSSEALDVISKSLDGRLAQILKIENSPVVSETESLALRALESVLERNLRTVRSHIIRH
ncbi:MAG: DNA repair protein RecO [Acidimicrobiaceae bacterium]|nr:DNA repair protein RecO [Acidimicrobiaceae bacterium]